MHAHVMYVNTKYVYVDETVTVCTNLKGRVGPCHYGGSTDDTHPTLIVPSPLLQSQFSLVGQWNTGSELLS